MVVKYLMLILRKNTLHLKLFAYKIFIIFCKIFPNFHPQFGDSQKLRLVRILRSTVMVRVGGGWVALDEFLVKNDPCRGMLWKNYFILPFQNKFIEKKIYFKNKQNFVTKKLKDAKENLNLMPKRSPNT